MKNTLIPILIAISSSAFAGGPWLTPKKTGFFQFQTTLPVGAYKSLFQKNSQGINLNRSVVDINVQAYLEYGITDKLNLIAVLPYKFISTKDTLDFITNPEILPEGSLNGFSNPRLGFKYRVLDKKVKAAVSVQSTFNTVSKELDKGLITGYDANSIGLYVHVGGSFSENLYSFVDIGANLQSNNYSDYLDIHYELGCQLMPNFWGVLTVDIRQSFRNGPVVNDNLRQTGFYTNDQEYVAYGPKLAYELDNKIGFTVATFGAVSGNYVAKIGTYSLGVYKKW